MFKLCYLLKKVINIVPKVRKKYPPYGQKTERGKVIWESIKTETECSGMQWRYRKGAGSKLAQSRTPEVQDLEAADTARSGAEDVRLATDSFCRAAPFHLFCLHDIESISSFDQKEVGSKKGKA